MHMKKECLALLFFALNKAKLKGMKPLLASTPTFLVYLALKALYLICIRIEAHLNASYQQEIIPFLQFGGRCVYVPHHRLQRKFLKPLHTRQYEHSETLHSFPQKKIFETISPKGVRTPAQAVNCFARS